ncbi:hypothetical protein N0V83_007805 [Neocucurbitaria cava]|uniref:Uncharacterized protein n=1 Tax=Neocucurbitaria cava TaxID=798079 RepID=A0A9W8Y2G6_9PLEO|nr:hypothetical protein N0V83_007805 [Neocucurbitaria cava]
MSSITLNPSEPSSFKCFVRMSTTKNAPTTVTSPPPSFARKTVLITGASSGIGLSFARLLATLQVSHLILAVRSMQRGSEVAAELKKTFHNTKVDVYPLDMSSYDSVQDLVRRCDRLPQLDIVILNAGLANIDYKTSPSTGHEEVFQVNYLSTALLSILLLPVLRRKCKDNRNSPGRLTIVGSALGLDAKFPNRNAVPLLPSFSKPSTWTGLSSSSEQYGVTKLLLFVLVLRLAEMVRPEEVIVNLVEPGFTGSTGLGRGASGVLKSVVAIVHKLVARSPEQAAWTYVDAIAMRGAETHGSFVCNWEIYP